MPSYRCKWPTCCAWVTPQPGYCPSHEDKAPVQSAPRHANYDREQRDEEAKRFYNSAAWLHVRAQRLAENPVCEGCTREWATDVHHKVPVRESAVLRLEPTNLVCLCSACHKRIEGRKHHAAARERERD
jgi:5-methylcytosine-specific restriction protein A